MSVSRSSAVDGGGGGGGGGEQHQLEYEGCNFLRMRLVLATVSGRAVKIRRIRPRDDNPGLREFEASLIRLFDKLTNGSKIEVSETGTTLFYQPGLLLGGKLEHDCSLERGIGYFLEPLLQLGFFCKTALHVTLRGVTSAGAADPSPDALKAAALPILKRFFLADEGLEIKVQKRGAAPAGGGQVLFRCPTLRTLRPLQLTDQGKIKRIRGVAWATRVSPAIANRLVESSKGLLLKFLPDVYIHSDHATGARSGKSPGFGLVLSAETTTGVVFTAEVCSKPAGGGGAQTVADDLGVEGAHRLFEEIYRGGCTDSSQQALALLLMAAGPRDVSNIVTGPLSDHSVHFLRHLRSSLQVMFKLERHCAAASGAEAADGDDDAQLRTGAEKVALTCLGVGYTNLSKRTT